MNQSLNFAILFVTLFILSSCGPEAAVPDKESSDSAKSSLSSEAVSSNPKEYLRDSITIDGISRSFEYQIPARIKADPSLVFVLHGSNGNVKDLRDYTDHQFEKIAAKSSKQIIVYPEGYDKHWNDCRGTASYKANQEDVNDIGFFTQMISYFSNKYKINKNAVFVTGISNGGHMCYKLGYEMPGQIKAIAPFVANIPEAANNDCSPKNEAMSVMIINGTNDPINPHEGGWVVVGKDSTRGSVLSTEQSFDYWKELAQCESVPVVINYQDVDPSDSSKVVHYKFTCAKTNKKVELLKVVNGGHTVPISDTPPIPERFKKIVGNKNTDINAPQMVIDFFESLVER